MTLFCGVGCAVFRLSVEVAVIFICTIQLRCSLPDADEHIAGRKKDDRSLGILESFHIDKKCTDCQCGYDKAED